ncbi:MAG: hypothetical protein M3R43_11255, partial [Acidobacteriota bacterium]|nr:hypothetical protein [Acidobacteriota bacterium]
HDLQLLINQLAALGERLPDFGVRLQAFTPFGVFVRYDLGVALTEAQRRQYRDTVVAVRNFVKERVDSLPLR